MDDDLRQLIEENNRLLLENIELSRQNSKKINKIHSYMRRTFIAKVLYWCVVILVAVGAFYLVQPHVNRVIDSYKKIQEQINNTTGIIGNSASILPETLDSELLLKDVGLIRTLFGGGNREE